MSLADEIREQPAVATRLLRDGRSDVEAIAERLSGRLAEREIDHVVIAARGSSDHAAIYAQYLFGAHLRLPVALATPSLISLYRVEPRLDRSLVIGISQSGRSPDIVAVVEEARRQGAMTVALTNDTDSPLAETADHVIDLRAGPELATAATKTYTTELVAAALLSTALEPPSSKETADLASLPALMSAALTEEPRARDLAAAHAKRERAVVLGRGYSYASAREWALKLQEMALVAAMPYSAADFEHGPLALAEPDIPVLAVAPSGPELEAQVALLTRLKEDHGARLLVISDSTAARGIDGGLALPDGIPPWLAPIVEILPAQLYAYHLTVARGLDPDHPRSIKKVTETR